MVNFILSSIHTIVFNVVFYHYYQILKIIFNYLIYFYFKFKLVPSDSFNITGSY